MGKYNENQEGLVTCLICGAKRRSLSQHIRVHGIKAWEYREMYPNAPMSCEETRKLHKNNCSKMAKALWNEESYEESRNQIRKVRSQNAKIQWTSNKKYIELMKEVGHEVMTRNLKDQEYIKKMQSPHLKEYQLSNGDTVLLRSGFEASVYDFLVRYNYKFIYEPKWIEYIREDGSKHHYTPDFYLPDYNLILEVKPSCYINNARNSCKKQGCIDAGYKFVFITEKDYWSDDKLNSLIVTT